VKTLFIVSLLLLLTALDVSALPRKSAAACAAALDKPSKVAMDIERDAEAEARASDQARNQLVALYSKFVREFIRTPTEEELAKYSVMTVNDLRKTMDLAKIEDMMDLKLRTLEAKPASFKNAKDTDVFAPQETSKTVDLISKAEGGLIVTSATAGQTLNTSAFDILLTKARREKMILIVIPTNFITFGLPVELLRAHLSDPNVRILTESLDLLPGLNLARVRPMPKNIDPFTGLQRLVVQLGQSIILPSPKAMRKRVPHLNNEQDPLDMISTGSITNPEYKTSLPVQQRTSNIAELDHVIGAIVLQKDHGGGGLIPFGGKPRYHIRRLDYLQDFDLMTDLNVAYHKDGTVKTDIKTDTIILGDTHVDQTDPQAAQALAKSLVELNPKYIVLHDLFDGKSVNPHAKGNALEIIRMAEAGRLNIREEINRNRIFIESLARLLPNTTILIPDANHNIWLQRYLQDAENVKLDRINGAYLSELLNAVNNMGRDALEYAISTIKNDKDGFAEWEEPMRRRVVFMGMHTRMKMGPDSRMTEVGQHGHAGVNGMRGSANSMALMSAQIAAGHTHSPMYSKYYTNVGTNTLLNMGYNGAGASNWGVAFGRISEYGDMQLVLFDKTSGRWYMPLGDDAAPASKAPFYPENYPKLIPNSDKDPNVEAIPDQYSTFLDEHRASTKKKPRR